MSLWWLEPLPLLIGVLAAYRITWCFVGDSLPYKLRRVRDWALSKFADDGLMNYLFTCYPCLSFWSSLAVIGVMSTGRWSMVLLVPIAFSALIGWAKVRE